MRSTINVHLIGVWRWLRSRRLAGGPGAIRHLSTDAKTWRRSGSRKRPATDLLVGLVERDRG
jgi:hypothetical protein